MTGARQRWAWGLALGAAALLLLTGCAHLRDIRPQDRPALYLPQAGPETALGRLAPAFLVHNPGDDFNRIGAPRAVQDGAGGHYVYVDSDQPAAYAFSREFQTTRGRYTNLFYRVHFPRTPASLVPFILAAGDNPGLLAVITLDQAERPVLVATVGTCGCYLSLSATNRTPAEALPQGWSEEPREIYGERLPARLDFGRAARSRLVVEVRPGEHRVMGLTVADAAGPVSARAVRVTPLKLEPRDRLTRLPLPQGGTTSFFYEDGPLAGHVKGAWKPWETFLLGPASLDAAVGMDKAYGDPRNPFYTSLKPWARRESDMNDFPGFLAYWGWRL